MSARRKGSHLDLAALGEFELIERIRKKLCAGAEETSAPASIVEGIGDDTAVLRWENGGDLLLLTCDTLVENVHFRTGTPPERIGWKALGCNLSDAAAMGGIPLYALVSLACPGDTKVADIEAMSAGMRELADHFGVAIVGGDTVESRGGLVVTVTVMGKVEEERYVSRHGARPGDVVCVTDTLGGSLLGKHLAFIPRVAEGRFLAIHCSPTAMIDVSDGLASDLMKIADASRITAEVYAEAIPVSEAAIRSAKQRKQSPISSALHDGEDFELLFTLPKETAEASLALFRKNFATPIATIGRIKRGRKPLLLVQGDGTTAPLNTQGYVHFAMRGRRLPSARGG
jgi:thiamine-monophosphate kinase